MLLGSQATPLEGGSERAPDVWSSLTIVIAGAATAWRRIRPMRALAIATLAGIIYWVADYPYAGSALAMMLLLFSIAAYEPERQRAIHGLVAFTVVISAVLIVGLVAPEEEGVSIGLIVLNLVLFQLAWFAGDAVRTRRERMEVLQRQVDEAAAAQRTATQRAVDDERTRIARELHDIVAHSMSVIVVQAEGAQRMIGKNDDAVASALGSIEQTARRNLNDIRTTVGALRHDVDTTPLPELSRLPALIDEWVEAGLDVSLDIAGEQRDLPGMVELSGYRVVQESLTNTMKHGGPAVRAEVTVDYQPERLSIAVVDNGRGAATPSTPRGHGLIGMRERIEAVGGELSVGPRVGGGYAVRAHIPVGAA